MDNLNKLKELLLESEEIMKLALQAKEDGHPIGNRVTEAMEKNLSSSNTNIDLMNKGFRDILSQIGYGKKESNYGLKIRTDDSRIPPAEKSKHGKSTEQRLADLKDRIKNL